MPRATDSRPPSPLPDSQRRMPSREMSPETKEVIERATEFLHDKSEPVPIRDLYNQIVEKDGCRRPRSGQWIVGNSFTLRALYGARSFGLDTQNGRRKGG